MVLRVMTLVGLGVIMTAGGCGSMIGPSDSFAVLEDDWFVDYDGSVIKAYEEAQTVTPTQRKAVSAACKDFTIVAIEVLPNGKVGAMEFKSIPGLDMQDGDAMYCKAVIVDRDAGEVTIDFGLDQEDCCEMLVEMLGSVIRMSCSGVCDNGEDCGLESETTGGLSSFTCACPDVP